MNSEERSKEYASGLRQLADWIEAHPSIDPPDGILNVCSLNTKEEAAACLKALAPCKKEYQETMFKLIREFGPISLRFIFYRAAVCTKKVVGTRHIEAYTKAAEMIPAQHFDAHDEEIVEWECGPITVPVGSGSEEVTGA